MLVPNIRPHRAARVVTLWLSSLMNWSYLARLPIIGILLVAERIAFVAPNNPGPKGEEMAKYGHVDTITRIATWFPLFSLVSNALTKAIRHIHIVSCFK